jgi:MYXO-CTERM domain-containing protein
MPDDAGTIAPPPSSCACRVSDAHRSQGAALSWLVAAVLVVLGTRRRGR